MYKEAREEMSVRLKLVVLEYANHFGVASDDEDVFLLETYYFPDELPAAIEHFVVYERTPGKPTTLVVG